MVGDALVLPPLQHDLGIGALAHAAGAEGMKIGTPRSRRRDFLVAMGLECHGRAVRTHAYVLTPDTKS
jgi:hypothetical protein